MQFLFSYLVQTIFWSDDVLQWRLQDVQSGYRTAFGVGHIVTLRWPEKKDLVNYRLAAAAGRVIIEIIQREEKQ